MVISCRTSENYYPPQATEMSEGIYNKYKVKLDTAYLRNDHFEVSVQLANLNAPPNMVYSNLDAGIRENTQNCYKVYEWYKLFKENNFQVNLVRADTLQFSAAYELCIAMLGKQTFIDFQDKKEQKHQKELDTRIKLDSTKFNPDLMRQLEQIEKDDQELRIKMNAKNITKEEEANLWTKQKTIDSINLNKVEIILGKYGYPNKERVGYGLANTVWLVLHHQSDIRVRDKYQEVIEASCGEGQIKAYNWRSEDIRLEQKHNKS
jgi:hypothetical protein